MKVIKTEVLEHSEQSLVLLIVLDDGRSLVAGFAPEHTANVCLAYTGGDPFKAADIHEQSTALH